mgnify:CR=1 FL=1
MSSESMNLPISADWGSRIDNESTTGSGDRDCGLDLEQFYRCRKLCQQHSKRQFGKYSQRRSRWRHHFGSQWRKFHFPAIFRHGPWGYSDQTRHQSAGVQVPDTGFSRTQGGRSRPATALCNSARTDSIAKDRAGTSAGAGAGTGQHP